ncbi:UPF0481 protein At3g47200-like [Telopea speciosissima]|uniref:UPF0481 protein At3g47200-like n=1 Tax=Telopea speciosissima TaxID=54955 RepID=UPI001CC5DA60|nr:UPF0481 protein At3g47200-like [Telopea speciosissima]
MSGVSMLVESIEKELQQVPTLPSNCTIYRVPVMLRKVKPEAYTPHLVTIGPFHRNKQHLKPMETHKLQYLNEFLRRNSQVNVVDYINALTDLEEKARKCYSEIINLKKDEFIKMLLMDGCFILELFLRRDRWEQYREDPLLSKTWMSRTIMRDLILLENQIPFFVLQKLKTLLNRGNSEARATHLNYLSRTFFGEMMLHRRESFGRLFLEGIFRVARDRNLIDFENLPENEEESDDQNDETRHLLDFVRQLHLPSSSTASQNYGNFRSIHSATELHDQGKVKFKWGSQTCLFEITFNRQDLSIPPIKIGDWTESFLRNLIAYEQSHSDCTKYVTAYAAFMDGLIVSPKDVELLQKNKIIDNLFGRPEKVSELFNKLLEEVTIPFDNFYFSGISEEVETYYEMIKESSMHYYHFNTSWAWGFLKRLPYLLVIFTFLIFAMKWRNISK